MGRHSASYLAAQQGLSTRAPARGAAAYVGRVGALALAMGIGVAVVGGPGIAYADESGGTDTGGTDTRNSSSPASTQPASTEPASTRPATDTAAGTSESTTDAATTGTVRNAESLTVPTMNVGTSNSAATVAEPAASTDPAELPDPDAVAQKSKRDSETARATTDAPATDTRAAVTKTAARQPTERPTGEAQPAVTTERTEPDAPRAVATATTAAATATPTPAAVPAVRQPVFVNPAVTFVSGILTALGFPPSATNPDGAPTTPMPFVLGVLQLVRREIENITLQLTWPLTTTSDLSNTTPAVATSVPAPDDDVSTPYGDIGKWMIQPNGQIANYGGVPNGGRQLLEPVNVIIVDPNSQSPEEAAARLNAAMFWSGFPAQPIHSTGFRGSIDEVTYGQQPNLPLTSYSNNLFVFPNDHGRIFGPDPAETATGYVWSGAFSSQQLTIFNGLPTHEYVSYDMARTALAMRLILSGRATYGGMVPLDNSYDTAETTTGDHDGYAVVLVLR